MTVYDEPAWLADLRTESAGALTEAAELEHATTVDNGRRHLPLADELAGKVLSVDALRNLPPPEPLVGRILVRNTLAVLYGPRGGGKSFVALDLALSISTGTWWHGRELAGGPVLYLAAEGTPGLLARVDAWLTAQRLHDPGEFGVLPVAVNLYRPEQAAALAELATRLKSRLVVIDTLARTTTGADENSARDMGIVVAGADAIRRATAATVLLVHHTGKDGLTLRGSSALEGAADTLIECKNQGQRIVLRCEKQKDDAPFDPIALHLVPTGDSCALATTSPVSDLPESRAAVLDLFHATFGATGATKVELRDAAIEQLALNKATAYRIINDLIETGALTNEGSPQRPFLVSHPG